MDNQITMQTVMDQLERLAALRTTLHVHPDDETAVREALAVMEARYTFNVDVQSSKYLPRGVMYVTKGQV